MGGASDLVHAQRAEGERLAGVGVDEQHLGVQNHTVAAGERPRDVVLEVCHLETGTKTIKGKERKKETFGPFRFAVITVIGATRLFLLLFHVHSNKL